MCAIAARSAARSPTTTRPPTIRRRCWRSARPSSPTSARSPPTSSSPACSRRRWRRARSSPRCSFTVPAKAGYAKFRNPASRYAMTGVFVAKNKDGVRVAVTGAGDSGVFRAKEIEAALAGNFAAGRARRHQGLGRQSDGRHPRLAGIPRQSDRGDGQARGGAGERVGAKIPPCLPDGSAGKATLTLRPGSLSASAGTALCRSAMAPDLAAPLRAHSALRFDRPHKER